MVGTWSARYQVRPRRFQICKPTSPLQLYTRNKVALHLRSSCMGTRSEPNGFNRDLIVACSSIFHLECCSKPHSSGSAPRLHANFCQSLAATWPSVFCDFLCTLLSEIQLLAALPEHKFGYDCYVSLGSWFLTGLQSTAASKYRSSEITSWGWHHGLRIYALGRSTVQVNFQSRCNQRTRRIGGPLVPNRMWASRK